MSNELKDKEVIDRRKKCKLWFPISFTKYYIEENRLSKELELVASYGLISKRIEKTKLYKINDISYHRGIGNFFCGVANLTLHSADVSSPTLRIEKIRKSKLFMKFLEDKITEERIRMNVGYNETTVLR